MVKTRVYNNKPEFYEKGHKKSKKRQAKQEEQKAKQVEAKEKALYTEAVFQFCKEWEEAHGIDRRGIVEEQYYRRNLTARQSSEPAQLSCKIGSEHGKQQPQTRSSTTTSFMRTARWSNW